MCKACEEHLRPCYLMKNIEGLGWEQEGSFSSSLAFAFFPKDSQKLPLEPVYFSAFLSKSVIEKEFRTQEDEPVLHF